MKESKVCPHEQNTEKNPKLGMSHEVGKVTCYFKDFYVVEKTTSRP